MHQMYAPQPNHYRPGMGGGMGGPSMQMGPPQMQCYCPACNTLLSFPSGATFVQCPNCTTTMNTQPSAPPPMAPPPPAPAPAPQQQQQQQGSNSLNFLHCPSCHCLLSHPPSSITIQCPRCMHIIDVSHKAATITAASDAQAGGGGAGSGVLGGHSSSVSKAAPLPDVVIRKKRKDPNAPKRASNAYMIFCKERRAQLKLDRPDLPFGQLGKRLGEMWRSMTPEEKRLYENRATGDRDRYKGEMNSYQSTAMMKGGSGRGSSGTSRHAQRDAGSEGDSHHDDGEGDGVEEIDGEDGEGEEYAEGGGSEDASGQDEEVQETKAKEKSNGEAKRVKSEVKVDTEAHAEKESGSD